MRAGHEIVAHDRSPDAVAAPVAAGATGADTPDAPVAALTPPRAVWLLLPAAITGRVARDLAGRLAPGDTIIDADNNRRLHSALGYLSPAKFEDHNARSPVKTAA